MGGKVSKTKRKKSRANSFLDISLAPDDNYHELNFEPYLRNRLSTPVGFFDMTSSSNLSIPGEYKINKILKKRVIIIGQAGHGKSTFINAMINYSFEKSPSDFYYINDTDLHHSNFKKDFKNQIDHKVIKINQGEGVTSECEVYPCLSNIEIIDTPGVSDKEGFDKDNKTIEKILNQARQSYELAGIIYVVNSTISRLDPSTQNSLNLLSSVIPQDFIKSVIVVYTHSPKGKKQFRTEWLPVIPYREFYFDIDVFNYSRDELKEKKKEVNASWKKIKSNMEVIFQKILDMDQKNVAQYELMYIEHNNAKSIFSKIKEELKNLIIVEKVLEDKRKFGESSISGKIKVVYFTKKEYYNTICLNCSKCCHENCIIEFIEKEGSDEFVNCQSFNDEGVCNECKCESKSHYHSFEIPKRKRRDIYQIIKEFTNIPISEETECSLVKLLTDSKAMRENIKNMIEKSKDDLKNSAILIKKICPKFNMRNLIEIERDSVKRTLVRNDIKRNEKELLYKWLETLHELRDKIDIYDN